MIHIWQLAIATVSIIISLAVFLWWINRANKADLEKQLDLKADKEVMKAELRIAHQKIIAQEIRLTEFEERQSAQMREFNDNLKYLRNKTDDIYKLLK